MLNDLLAKNQSSDKLYVEDVFSTWLYTGNNTTNTITNGIDLSGKGGLVWLKSRASETYGANIFVDTARGRASLIASSNTATTNATNGAYTSPSNTDLVSFNSNGFTLGGDNWFNKNTTNATYASWTFRKAPKFFDVVTVASVPTAPTLTTVNHSLGVTPGMIIYKRTDGVSSWMVWHRSTGNNNLALEITGGAGSTYAGYVMNVTASSFQVYAADFAGAYVFYVFAHDTTADGVIQCGSYTGAYPSTVTVNLGWEPQYILVKNASRSSDWGIFDVMRGMPLGDCNTLAANSSAAENGVLGQAPAFKATATGFIVDSGLTAVNVSGDTHIYVAIRRGPMRVPTDATKVFKLNSTTSSSSYPAIENENGTNLNTDAWLYTQRVTTAGTYQPSFSSRLTGLGQNNGQLTSGTVSTPALITRSTDAESSISNVYRLQWNATSYLISATSGQSTLYGLRRSPGFFDVLCYTGTGSTRTVSHNLGVSPELMIFKSRNTASTNWAVCIPQNSTTYSYLTLQTSNVASSRTYGPGGSPNFEELSAAPTASVLNIASSAELNASGRTFVAYLFATCPGVSKIGSYTGTGSTLNIDCGFTNGARFVLIKAVNDATNWCVFDTARGITTGNDPLLLLNTADAEYTTYNAINPLSSGFSLPANSITNQLNVQYLYLAIA